MKPAKKQAQISVRTQCPKCKDETDTLFHIKDNKWSCKCGYAGKAPRNNLKPAGKNSAPRQD